MADKQSNLHPKNDSTTYLKPNIIGENIPDKTVEFRHLNEDLQNTITTHIMEIEKLYVISKNQYINNTDSNDYIVDVDYLKKGNKITISTSDFVGSTYYSVVLMNSDTDNIQPIRDKDNPQTVTITLDKDYSKLKIWKGNASESTYFTTSVTVSLPKLNKLFKDNTFNHYCLLANAILYNPFIEKSDYESYHRSVDIGAGMVTVDGQINFDYISTGYHFDIDSTDLCYFVLDLSDKTFKKLAYNAEIKDDYALVAMYWEDKIYSFNKIIGYGYEGTLKGRKLGFLGDSTTIGSWGGEDGSNWRNIKYPYPAVLGVYLQATSLNYGIGGTHISGAYTRDDGLSPSSFTNRYQSMAADLDVIVVMGGTNDYGHAETAPFGTPADTTDVSFYGGLDVLCRGLKDKYGYKPIIFMTPLPRADQNNPNPTTGKNLKDYCDAIKLVCARYSIPVIDLNSASCFAVYNPGFIQYYMNDSLHPNPRGHILLARWLMQYFKNVELQQMNEIG